MDITFVGIIETGVFILVVVVVVVAYLSTNNHLGDKTRGFLVRKGFTIDILYYLCIAVVGSHPSMGLTKTSTEVITEEAKGRITAIG